MDTPEGVELERMHCMEIWGGNRSIQKNFEAPGVDLFVHSVPFEQSRIGGGDIYYLTSCASGRITRLLLADVSGHGEAVSSVAVSLRDLLRDNVNTISQERFVKGMNQEFGQLTDESLFATAAVATYFEPRKSLALSVAGHPHPLYYRSAKKHWDYLDPEDVPANEVGSLPLGVHKESSYPIRNVTTEPGDMFLLYSDAFIESVDRNNKQLGIAGLLRILNEMQEPHPSRLIPNIRTALRTLSPENLMDDDATLIMGHFTPTKVRFRDNLMAPARLLGKVRDNTNL